jgi:DNA-binding CsgD family transcriptional regulator
MKKQKLPFLTGHEERLLKLLAQDIPYYEIADRLKRSPRTIDGYRDKLFEKLGVTSRIGLVVWAYNVGLVTPTGPKGVEILNKRPYSKKHLSTRQIHLRSKKYEKALHRIIYSLQCCKEDKICADIIKTATEALA